MSFIDRLFGRDDQPNREQQRRQYPLPAGRDSGQLSDQQAVERYRYLLRTAPPETIEQVHQEAFAQLTPEQRRLLLQQLSANLPEYERRSAANVNPDDPQALARVATRAEIRQPGTLERTFSSMPAQGMGVSMGGLMAGNFLSSLAGVVVGSMIFQSFFDNSGYGYEQGYPQGYDQGSQAGDNPTQDPTQDAGYDQDTGTDTGADYADFGSDAGDFGGDMGGDFGGDF